MGKKRFVFSDVPFLCINRCISYQKRSKKGLISFILILENKIQIGLEVQSLSSYSLIQFLKFILMKMIGWRRKLVWSALYQEPQI